MKRHLAFPVLLWLAWPTMVCADGSWIFAPAQYSHDPSSGQRVTQYAPPAPAYYQNDPTYLRSGYHHTRTSFQFGDSYDNLHTVETWGAGEWIRPYGEWQYPYRAGATPYGPWGNAFGPWTTPYGTIAGPYGQGWPPTSVYRPGYPGALPSPYAGQQQIPLPPQPQPPRP